VADGAGGAVVDGHGDGVASIVNVRGDQKRLRPCLCAGLAVTIGSHFFAIMKSIDYLVALKLSG